jgi:thiamine-monophosphate kinase
MEARLIELIRRHAEAGSKAGVRVGIGDDAAVLELPPGGLEMLVTTDQVIENTHFVMDEHPPGPLGAKTLARGVSDIAAMGGRPLWFALSLAVPKGLDFHWLEQFLLGMFSVIPTNAVQAYPLVGGDVARAPFFAANVTAAGVAPEGRALLRSQAKAGDRLCVSGRLGGSALGLERLHGGAGMEDEAVRRHCAPEARLGLGSRLWEWGVRACMDLSDGLSMDAGRLAESSGVAVVIEAAKVPQFPGAGLERALHGGEEYELLFTAPEGAKIPEEYEGLALTCIGRVEEGEGLWVEDGGGRGTLRSEGFDHFG